MAAQKSQYGNDPKGSMLGMNDQMSQRYYNQQGPMVNAFAQNYGRGSEANYGDYTDIMNQYRDIASGGGSGDGGGGGGYTGAGDYSAFTVSPGRAGYSDPFKSYGGYEEFSKTGGYSPEDIANMRARGTAPVRAAYANAEQQMGRNRSLQGGYSPNMAASLVKMAREQGQGGADAMQGVESNLAQMRQQGRLAGLGGMSNIEGQRLGADVDLSKFNTGLDFQGQTYNADAQSQAQARNIGAAAQGSANSAASAADNQRMRLAALGGMTSLYGTTPGMSETFGNQLLQGVGQGGQYDLNRMGQMNNAQKLPGQFEQTTNRLNTGLNIAGKIGDIASTAMTTYKKKQPSPTSTSSYNPQGWSG